MRLSNCEKTVSINLIAASKNLRTYTYNARQRRMGVVQSFYLS